MGRMDREAIVGHTGGPGGDFVDLRPLADQLGRRDQQAGLTGRCSNKQQLTKQPVIVCPAHVRFGDTGPMPMLDSIVQSSVCRRVDRAQGVPWQRRAWILPASHPVTRHPTHASLSTKVCSAPATVQRHPAPNPAALGGQPDRHTRVTAGPRPASIRMAADSAKLSPSPRASFSSPSANRMHVRVGSALRSYLSTHLRPRKPETRSRYDAAVIAAFYDP